MRKPIVDGIFQIAVIIVTFVIIHELIHSQIYTSCGCKDVKFGIGIFDGYPEALAYTMCIDEGYAISESCQLAHSLNEVIGNYALLATLFIYVALMTEGKEG